MRKLFDYFKLLYTNFGKGKRYSREDTISGNTVYENHQRVMKKAQNIIVSGNIIVPMGYGFCILSNLHIPSTIKTALLFYS